MLPCCYNPLVCGAGRAAACTLPGGRPRDPARLRSPATSSHAPAGRPYPFPLSLSRPLRIRTLYSERASISQRPAERWRRKQAAGQRWFSRQLQPERLTHARARTPRGLALTLGSTEAQLLPDTSQDLHDLAHVTSFKNLFSPIYTAWAASTCCTVKGFAAAGPAREQQPPQRSCDCKQPRSRRTRRLKGPPSQGMKAELVLFT